MTLTPDNAAAEVILTVPVSVRASNGWIQRVALVNADGRAVAGALNRDRTEFATSEPLGYGRSTRSGSVVGRDGQPVGIAGSFTTVEPSKQVNGQFQL